MRHNLKLTNTSGSPEITAYLEKKLAKLDAFIPVGDTSGFADVELERTMTHSSGEEFRAEITAHTASGDFRAEAAAATLLAAIDGAVENAMREMRRNKRKGMRFSRLEGLKFKSILRGWPFRRS